MEINGKKVVVIGGASGMGRATAELLAERGADVAIFDREGSDGKSVAEGIGGAFYPVDVTDFTGTEETLQTAVDKLGGLHVIVTTAGGGIAKRTMTKTGPHDLESFQSVIDLNLIATFNISRLAAAHMAKNEPEDEERGVIINTASVAAYEGQIGQIAYSASKGGVVGLTLPAARDLAQHKIRVITIAPGLFLTPLLMGLNEEARKSLGAQVPHPARLGDAAEYGNLAVHIVENAMLNGETIRLDGAIRMAPR